MRKMALSLIFVAAGMALASAGWAQEGRMLVGKYVSWETWEEESAPQAPSAPGTQGESLETPNQARKRLGLAPETPLPQEDTSKQLAKAR